MLEVEVEKLISLIT